MTFQRLGLWLMGGLALAACGSAPDGKTAKPAEEAPVATAHEVMERYCDHVYKTYLDAHAAAVGLDRAVDALVNEPSEQTLAAAKDAWIRARQPYGRTEAFRFYEGPIDAPARAGRDEGPEGRLNGWPLNEAYIDYVQGDPKAGLIHQGKVPLTEHELSKRNAAEDEADVTTGFHAIEFLLWGQDLNPDGPGRRPVADYMGNSPTVQRRAEYLKVVTNMVVADLKSLVDEWAPDRDNYRARFLKLEESEALGHILTGLATLSGFELATERIGVPLDSGSQEDEQSCFSDTTHRDYLFNIEGIHRVYSDTGLAGLIAQADPDLAQRIGANLAETRDVLRSLQPPVDRVLASSLGSEGRRQLEDAVTLLQAQAKLFVEAGKKLGAEVSIAAE